MVARISRFVAAFAPVAVYAQAAEAPVEKASMGTVLLFLVIFAASCIGYGWYAWQSSKKEKPEEIDEKTTHG